MIKQIPYNLTKVNIALSLQVLGRTLYFTDISEIKPLLDQINFGSSTMCGALLLHQSVWGTGISEEKIILVLKTCENYFSENKNVSSSKMKIMKDFFQD